MINATRLLRTGAATLALLAGGLTLAIAPALAGTGHGLTGTFGSASTSPVNPEPLSDPQGVAVSQKTEDVYVVDRGNNRVEYFTAAGAYIGQFDGSAAPTGQLSSPDYIAVDNDASSPSYGDVYVNSGQYPGPYVIDKFTASGVYLCQLRGPHRRCLKEAGEETKTEQEAPVFEESNGVAVGANGLLWVASSENLGYISLGYIGDFSDELSNEFVATLSAGGGTLPELAVDSKGNLYRGNVKVENAGDTGPHPRWYIEELNPKGEVLSEKVDSERSEEENSETESVLGVTVELSSDNVYIDSINKIELFSSSGTMIESFGLGLLPNSGNAAGAPGIAVDDSTGTVYVADEINNDVNIFTVGPTPATPTTAPASGVVSTNNTTASATLSGDLNPGGRDTHYFFRYNSGTACTGAGTTAVEDAGAAEEEVPVSASLTALKPSTEYTACLVAEDTYGHTTAAPVSFTTPAPPPAPALTPGQASDLTETSATILATVDPEGLSSFYYYQYGPSAEYGLNTPKVELGAGTAPLPAPAGLIDLAPDTTYHYRLVSENEDGISYGADQQFTTGSDPLPDVLTGAVSAVSQNAATLTGTVGPNGVATSYAFQIGIDTSYGVQVYAQAGSGTEPLAVSLAIEDLQPGTTYHYRLIASSLAGTVYGADQTLTTPSFPTSVIAAPPTPPLIATPAIQFPTETGGSTPVTKSLTRTQKLAKALKACKRKAKGRRAGCEKQARARYGAVKKRTRA